MWGWILAFGLSGCATLQMSRPVVSILVDLDPASTDRTVIVESITADRQGRLYLADWVTGNILRVDPKAPKPAVVARLPDGKTQQPIVANGIAFDTHGILCVTDTARGAIWKVTLGADGRADEPNLFTQSPLLEGADGLDFDPTGRLWVTANERNALVTVTSDGKVQEIARNGSHGPLEFPSAIVFVGNTAYVSNNDTARRDNRDAGGTNVRDGIGASVAQITL
jgi:sugar lactone lactonase YvrE